MKLLNLSGGPTVSGSKYLFYKSFDTVKDVLEIHYVCKMCNVNMEEFPHTVKCHVFDLIIVKVDALCFLYLPLEHQVKTLLRDHNLRKHLGQRFEE